MPQEIRVLCCLKCKMYQVDIVKKAKIWQCKMCHERQSVFKEFYRGSGAECRQKAQELNLNANSEEIDTENEILNLLERDDLNIDLEYFARIENDIKVEDKKWTQYDDPPKENIYKNVGAVGRPKWPKRKPSDKASAADFSSAKTPRPSTSSKWDL